LRMYPIHPRQLRLQRAADTAIHSSGVKQRTYSLHTAPYQTRWCIAAYDNLQALSVGSNGSTATAARSQGGRPSRRVRTDRGREAADQ
jgi:hypothetical protein